MRSKKLILLLFSIQVLCSNFSCSKDKLTKATQTGANTFSCKVDGKVFRSPETGGFFGGEPVFVNNLTMSGFTLLGKSPPDDNGIRTIITIQLQYLQATGNYSLSNYPYGQYRINYSGGFLYNTNAAHTGTVNITRCDNSSGIYSGTFSFTAIDENTGKVVKITDGRFDVKQ